MPAGGGALAASAPESPLPAAAHCSRDSCCAASAVSSAAEGPFAPLGTATTCHRRSCGTLTNRLQRGRVLQQQCL